MSRRERRDPDDLDPDPDPNPNPPAPPPHNPHRSDENTYAPPNSHPHSHSSYTSLTSSSPTYQLSLHLPHLPRMRRRLSRAQEMVLVHKLEGGRGGKGGSTGLRVEGGELRRLDLDLDWGVEGEVMDRETGMGELVERRDEWNLENVDMGSDTFNDEEAPRSKGLVDTGLELRMGRPSTSHVDKDDRYKTDDIAVMDDSTPRSPETPARLDSFRLDKDGAALERDTREDDIPPATPLSTSTSAPLPLPLPHSPSSLPSTHSAPPKKPRSTSISSFLSSLKHSAMTSRPFFPKWTSVGHESGVPERLVVGSDPIEVDRGEEGKKNKKKERGVELDEVDVEVWSKVERVGVGRDWGRSRECDYGWGDEDQEGGYEVDLDDPREELAEIANRTALDLEDHQDGVDGGRPDSGGFEGSAGADHQDGWKRFDVGDGDARGGFVEDETGKGELDETIPTNLFQHLDISTNPQPLQETQQPGELPPTAPPRKPIHYRHIIHLASNTMHEPRPERIIYHQLFERIIRVARVGFDSAVMSVWIEVNQGRMGMEHYTLHDVYSWYKTTFRKNKVEGETLQALLLALVQVAAGVMLGESEEATLQALQGNSTILCAVPMGCCLVHAGVYDSETTSTLDKDLEGEVMGNQEMVLPDLEQGSDVSSDTASASNTPLTPPSTPKRKFDKGKSRALEDDDDDDDDQVRHSISGLAPQDTPPRPSSALPISDTQYSVFPRIIGMVSKRLQCTTELALFQPEVERALMFAGITCEQFQEVMFKAQELDQDEMSKRWEDREFVCPDVRWQASRYFEAISAISPFGAAVYVRQLPAYQRALIYLMMMCFDWPGDQPEEFVSRLENEHKLVLDHNPYKPSRSTNTPVEYKVSGQGTAPTRPNQALFESPEQWLESIRIQRLQIGPSTKKWQTTT